MNNVIYCQKDYPVIQNRVYSSPEEAITCALGDITLVHDMESGLIYNKTYNPDIVFYDSEYNNEQSLSQSFQKHLSEVAAIIGASLGTKSLVEVGCGKGYFLEMLLEMNYELVGFDPTYTGTNPRVIKTLYEPGLIKDAKGIILRHVLEHVPNPVAFLKALKESNQSNGLIYIEVPCFDWICNNRAWQDIFYEHVNYFRLEDFLRIFGSVKRLGHFFNGQYIYVVADLNTVREPIKTDGDIFRMPLEFEKSVSEEIVEKPCGIWGAASKGVIFSLRKSRIDQFIEFAVDINPHKQNKYLPVTGLRVISPARAIELYPRKTPIYVMNPNYLKEIELINSNHFNLIPLG
jgi:hypothetical protein